MFALKVYVRLQAAVHDIEGTTIQDCFLKAHTLHNSGETLPLIDSLRVGKLFDIRLNTSTREEATAIQELLCRYLVNSVVEEYECVLEELQ